MKTIFFTVADKKNKPWALGLKNSLKQFHPDVPFKIYGPKYCEETLKQDPHFFYRATPMIARDLIKKYDEVIKIDADSVVCGNLDHIFKDASFEAGTVMNFNQKDTKQFGNVAVWNVAPQSYFNCGFVVMRNKRFIDHWWELCNRPYFGQYQYREQDLLNIICHYGDYRIKCLDASDYWHGLVSKDAWQALEYKDGNIQVRFVDKDGNQLSKKILKVLHWGEGHNPNKMEFATRFAPDVAQRLDELTKHAKKT